MKTVIFAGGRGTRLMDETHGLIPKPLVMVAGRPLIEHVMDTFFDWGYSDFVVAGGHMIEKLFGWNEDRAKIPRVHVIVWDTGLNTGTGGRLWELRTHMQEWGDEFFATFGDGVADVNLAMLRKAHERNRNSANGPIVTLTAAHAPSRFGKMIFDGDRIVDFAEKPLDSWVNAGYYVVDKALLDLIPGPQTSFELDFLPTLAANGQLFAFKHTGYFQMVDNWRERQKMEEDFNNGAPWRTGWEEIGEDQIRSSTGG